MTDIESKYLNTAQAAQYVGGDVTFRTIVRWIHAGHLKAFRNPSKRGHWKILPDDLDAALKLMGTKQ